MAKRNAVTITLPHNVTLKVDKLESRTIKTVKPGDYLLSALVVRGVECFFFGEVVSVEGNVASTVFGSEKRSHKVSFSKGEKVNVYRPL